MRAQENVRCYLLKHNFELLLTQIFCRRLTLGPGIVRVKVGSSYDPLRFSPSLLRFVIFFFSSSLCVHTLLGCGVNYLVGRRRLCVCVCLWRQGANPAQTHSSTLRACMRACVWSRRYCYEYAYRCARVRGEQQHTHYFILTIHNTDRRETNHSKWHCALCWGAHTQVRKTRSRVKSHTSRNQSSATRSAYTQIRCAR